MDIVLASGNKGKIKEFRSYMEEFNLLAFTDIMEPFEIIENGKSFKENALIKARAVYEKVKDENIVVMADDSGISVDILGGKPGIYSARYAGKNATSEQNLDKLIEKIREKKLKRTPAFYTAAIAIISKRGEFCVHGWMHGDIIDEKRGKNGFGYDPIFIPLGFKNTLGELGGEVKREFSHRSKALELAKIIIKSEMKSFVRRNNG